MVYSQDGTSHGSSSDSDVIVERVVAVRPDGVELDYDFPPDAKQAERMAIWQLPARLYRTDRGAASLLNAAALEARIDSWLKAGGITRAACGRLIFTWNAFRIDCDLRSVVVMIDSFDMGRQPLRGGDPYKAPLALASGTLMPVTGSGGHDFVARMTADPDAVRHRYAETDFDVAEIMHKPLTMATALAARSEEAVTGTITTTFHIDPQHDVRRRTTVTSLMITRPGARVRTETITTIVQRRPLP